jgi:hypothetical protein
LVVVAAEYLFVKADGLLFEERFILRAVGVLVALVPCLFVLGFGMVMHGFAISLIVIGGVPAVYSLISIFLPDHEVLVFFQLFSRLAHFYLIIILYVGFSD